MADSRFEYEIVANVSQAMRDIAKFTQAQQKSIQRIEKSNRKLDRKLVTQRKELSIARRELAKYTAGKGADAVKAEEAARAHNKLSKSISKTTEKIRKGKRQIAEHRRELERLQRTADKGIKIKPSRQQYPAPIGPQRPDAPMMGPGFDGRRGFLGQQGRRAGFSRNVQNLSRQASAGFSALGGAAGGGGLLAPLASGFALQQSVSGALDLDSQRQKLKLLSDQYGEYDQILKIIDNSAETFNKSQREATTEFANVFARLRPLGVELHQIKGVYEGFNSVAIKSGATSNASRIAFMQLAQAIGSGRLAGDEFRSVSEQIPGVLIPIAQTMGVAVGELKELGSEGKITSDVLIQSLSKGVNISKEEIKAFLEQQPAQKFKAFSNAVSDLGVVVGDTLLPILLPIVEKLTEVLQFIQDLPGPIRNVVVVAGVAAISITALAAAFKTLGLGIGVKFVGNLAASALGIKGVGLASAAALPPLLLLKKALLGLGLLGIITVGVNVVVNGLDKMAQLEARFKGIEEFQKPGSFLKSIGGSALSKQELDTVIKDVEAQLAKDLARGGVSDPSDIITGNFRDEIFSGFDNAARDAVLSGLGRLNDLREAKKVARFNTPEDRQVADQKASAARFQAALDKANKGKGDKTAEQLAKTQANNQLRLIQRNAQVALQVARDEYKLRLELEKSNHALEESNLIGVARQQQAILNARIAAVRELEQRQDRLKDEVTAAEQRLEAARQRVQQATDPVDRARAQGAVDIAQTDLLGNQQKLANFQAASPVMFNNITAGVSAKSTEALRQQTKETQIQIGELRKRNQLLMQGVSPEVLQAEMAKFEIDRATNDQLDRLNTNRAANAQTIRDVKQAAIDAKDAIDQLTEAQQQGAGAIGEYISQSMQFVTDIKARIVDIALVIEDGIASAIQGVIEGTMTASQAFGQFFQTIAKSFLQMASQMIAKLIVINLLKRALGPLFNFGSPGFDLNTTQMGAGTDGVLGGMGTFGPNFGFPAPTPNANGNVLRGGFQAFANGGVVKSPTLGLIGEGRMNEAVVPLPDGRAIPVDMGKGAAGNIQTNITVNVDQGGNTEGDVSGDNANKLGLAINNAVKRVIMDERRAGGLLHNGRR